VIEALEDFRGSRVPPADDRAAVRASVVKYVHAPGLSTADHEHRPAAHRTAYIVARIPDLRLVTDVEPRAAEDPLHLKVEYPVRCETVPVDTKPAVLVIVIDESKNARLGTPEPHYLSVR
jgi:hypothetical protein